MATGGPFTFGSRAWLALLALPLLCTTGCARSFWREYADWEVYNLVRSASHDPRWEIEDYTIAISPESRLFDPYPPDRPPMPPDDPTTHRLMHCVDCKLGFPCWHENGDIREVEQRNWRSHLPLAGNGEVLLNRRTAMELGLLHSPDYQFQLETLYLSALDVAFERFRFDTQFFGGDSTFYQSDGRLRSGTGTAQSTLSTGSSFQGRPLQVRKTTASGGQVIVGVANSLVWQFSGPNNYNANTILDFTLMQPLLRAGGRKVVLERLTRVERGLLANLRAMELYRRGFYIDVLTGISNVQGPSRQGGFFGGSGLDNFAGVGGGGFGRVGGLGGGGVATLGGSGAGAQQAGGLIGLLQQNIIIQNIESNVAGLRDSLAQLQASYDAGRIDKFQVDLARQNLYLLQSTLLNNRANYQLQVDQFKTSLGLPPTLRVKIEDPLLERYQLIDPGLMARQDRLGDLLDDLRDPDRPAPAGLAEEDLERLEAMRREAAGQVAQVESDLDRLRKALPDRRQSLRRMAKRPAVVEQKVEGAIYDLEAFDRRVALTDSDFRDLAGRFEETSSAIRKLYEADSRPAGQELNQQLVQLTTRLSAHLADLLLIQARARLDSARIATVEITPEKALRVASVNRLDWMNARLGLVDSWRLVEFNANALLSQLNVIFSGDIRTTDNNPVQFRSSTGRLRVGVEFDAPLTRISERNNYRQSLIEYQQARRGYMAFRDRIALSLRNRVRQLELNELNFEIRRAAVQLAISQVELTRLRLDKPPQPGEAAPLSNTTARDLIDSLNNLTNAQNDFLNVWVNFEVQRMGLDFELGTMVLDDHGNWIDPGPIVFRDDDPDLVQDPEATLPPEGGPLDTIGNFTGLTNPAPEPTPRGVPVVDQTFPLPQ